MSSKRRTSVRRNIRLALAAAAMKKHTIAHLSKSKTTALGKQAAKTAGSKRQSRAA